MSANHLRGLIAATHTPFHADGTLNLAPLESLAEHLDRIGVAGVFIGGTTGESLSLSIEERMNLAERWSEICKWSPLKLIVHVGSNSLADARTLAHHASTLHVTAISAVAPCYFKPTKAIALVEICREIASAAPLLPFYYYDIPSFTGIQVPLMSFVEQVCEAVPNFAGIKFSNPDLALYQNCLHFAEGQLDLPFGIDEYLLAAVSLGAKAAVGSSYNFSAPIYLALLRAVEAGDWPLARALQYQGLQIIQVLAKYGYLAASKCVLEHLGIAVGTTRLPLLPLDATQEAELKADLDQIGFWELVTPTS
ncbi:MAG: dihydrodipicolinate synthase family protein [Zavarzinella sp.]